MAVTESLQKACSEAECAAPAARKGMCNRHYMREYRRGTTALLGMHSRTCEECGGSFRPSSNRQKYCTACGRRGTSTCEQCGEAFKRTANTSGRWCSRQCSLDGKRTAETKPRPCLHCGVEFRPGNKRQKYCSKACFGAANARPLQTCPVCETVFDSRHFANTCSRACAGELRRRNPGGSPCRTCGTNIPWKGDYNHLYCSDECRRTPIGTLRRTDKGYLHIYVGPDYEHGTQNATGWMPQHRYVVEQRLGRALLRREKVHHKNARRDDNRDENLELWRGRAINHPSGVRADDYHCPGCRCSEL